VLKTDNPGTKPRYDFWIYKLIWWSPWSQSNVIQCTKKSKSGEIFKTSYNILQHLTTSYNILQHLTASYSILQHLTASYSILQHLTTSYNILQHLTTSNNILQHLTTSYLLLRMSIIFRRKPISILADIDRLVRQYFLRALKSYLHLIQKSKPTFR
jgi:hypothetical protein